MNTTIEKHEGLSLAQLQANQFEDHNSSQKQFSNEDDRNIFVRFFTAPLKHPAKSQEEGREVYVDTEYIEMRVAGDNKNVVIRQVFPMDIQRFPNHYAKFKQGQEAQVIGTPLSEMPFLSASKVKEYEYFHVRTVEQLAGVADGSDVAGKMMGFQADKQRAQAFLQASKGMAPINDLTKKLEESNDTVKILQEQVNRLVAAQSQGKSAVKAEEKTK